MSDMCPNCKSKLLFAEPSYDNFNGCKMYVCRSEFRKSGECYFKSPLCEERKVHSETREDLEHWKIEYEIAVSRLCGIKHKRDNGIIAENEVIPKLQCELDEARAKLDQTKDALADESAELALKKLQTEQVKSERDEARQELNDIRLNLGADADGYTLLHAVCAVQNERDEARGEQCSIQCAFEESQDKIEELERERDAAREAMREMWQSGDAFLPYIDNETTNRWRKAAGWEETK